MSDSGGKRLPEFAGHAKGGMDLMFRSRRKAGYQRSILECSRGMLQAASQWASLKQDIVAGQI